MKRLLLGLLLVLPLLASGARAASLPEGDPQALGFTSEGLASLDGTLQQMIADGAFPGAVVLIARQGRIAHLGLHGSRTPDGPPMTADTLFRIYSMTKPIVSVAALALVERGRIDLDQPLSDFIPAYAATRVATGMLDADGEIETVPAERPITIRDLMRHTSGLTYGFFGQGVVRQAYRSAGAAAAGLANVEAAAFLATLPLEHQPGTTWEYSRSTDVLGAVVEIAHGKPLSQAIGELVLQPLGMHDTHFTVDDPADHPRIAEARPGDGIVGGIPLYDPRVARPSESGGGGLISTVHDYARFAQMLLNGGELDGVRILKPETVALMTRDHTISAGLKPGKYYIPGRGYGFGLGVGVRISDEGAALPGTVGDYFWGGAGGTYYFADPQQDMFVVYMMQSPQNRRGIRAIIREGVYGAMQRR